MLPTDYLKLQPDQIFKIAAGFARGKHHMGGFPSDYFSNNIDDSGIVIFDGLYSVVHYINTPQNPTFKSILYGKDRNIFSINGGYKYEFNDPSKYRRVQTYSYIFVEADYEIC